MKAAIPLWRMDASRRQLEVHRQSVTHTQRWTRGKLLYVLPVSGANSNFGMTPFATDRIYVSARD